MASSEAALSSAAVGSDKRSEAEPIVLMPGAVVKGAAAAGAVVVEMGLVGVVAVAVFLFWPRFTLCVLRLLDAGIFLGTPFASSLLAAPLFDAETTAAATEALCLAVSALDAASPTSSKCARHGSYSGSHLKSMSYNLWIIIKKMK